MVDDKENGLVGASSSSLSAFGEGKIRIKLKIPKHEEEEEEEEEDGLFDEENSNYESGSQEKDHHEENNSNTKICQVCNKVFNSGKALGGHMRIHFQAYKELMISKKKLIKLKVKRPIKLKKQKVSCFEKNKNVDSKKPKCVECGKNFPSMKSLFGHMRCHPERDWRGIEPPPAAKNSSPASSVSDAEPEETDDDQIGLGGDANDEDGKVDLVESLPGWSVTARRGRKTISGSSEEELHDAARSILLLAGDGDSMETTNSNSLTDADRAIGVKRTRIGSANGFSNDDHDPMTPLGNEGRCSTNGMVDVDKGKPTVESDSSSDDPDSKDSESLANLIKNKKKRKKMKLRDLEQMQEYASPTHQTPTVMITASTSPSDHKYRCSTCGKSFPTHQALGGHRSSHNKLKIVIQNSIDESHNSSAAAVEDDHKLANAIIPPAEENKESEGAASSKLMLEATHQCNICSKNFHSGQALGGHKRCHWSGVMSPGEVSQTGRRMLDFDLNVAPPMELDEANADYYGYASSSCI